MYFAVTLQKGSADYETPTDSSSARGWADEVWIFILGWTFPLTIVSKIHKSLPPITFAPKQYAQLSHEYQISVKLNWDQKCQYTFNLHVTNLNIYFVYIILGSFTQSVGTWLGDLVGGLRLLLCFRWVKSNDTSWSLRCSSFEGQCCPGEQLNCVVNAQSFTKVFQRFLMRKLWHCLKVFDTQAAKFQNCVHEKVHAYSCAPEGAKNSRFSRASVHFSHCCSQN